MSNFSALLQSVALFLILALTASDSHAQAKYTYSPQGAATLRSDSGEVKEQVIAFTSKSDLSLMINVAFTGDQRFSYKLSRVENGYLYIPPGPPNRTEYVTITYQPSPGDTSTAQLVFYNRISDRDTIDFTGITMPPPTPADWSTERTDYYFGYHYDQSDSDFVYITNTGESPAEITASIIGNGFTLVGPTTRTVPAKSQRYIEIEYDAGAPPADGILRLTDGKKTVDVALHGNRLPKLADSLYFEDIDFGEIGYNNTLCRTLTIHNRYHTGALIKSIRLSHDGDFYIQDLPTLPLTLDAGKSIDLTVCYTGRFEEYRTTSESFWVTFQFLDEDSTLSRFVDLTGGSSKCAEITDYITFGVWDGKMLLPGASRINRVQIRNERSSPVTISNLELPAGTSFSLLTPAPITVAGKDSGFIEFKWDAIGASFQHTLARYTIDGCGTKTSHLLGAYKIPLFAAQSNTLTFKTDTTQDTLTYCFFNDQTDSITVLSIALAQQTHFTITDIFRGPPPFKLAPGWETNVTMRFNGNIGQFDDTLIIVTENSLAALRFPIAARIVEKNTVADPKPSSTLSISPNPGLGNFYIDLKGGTATSIEVLDALGGIQQTLEPDAKLWDSRGSAAGSYFIRVTGVDPHGSQFVITRRVIKH
jgi:hypothetical protein